MRRPALPLWRKPRSICAALWGRHGRRVHFLQASGRGAGAQARRRAARGERPNDSRLPLGALSKRRLLAGMVAVVLVMLLVAGLFAWRSTMARPTPELAVLPFEDLSPTHDKAYFAQGVAEEIQSTLAA